MYTAREVIQRHQDAINERDLAKYIDTTVFPFTYQNYNGTAITVEKPEEYGSLFPAPWKTVLAAFPDWVLTKHDAVDELVAGENSAVFKVVARWLTQDEKPHKPITAVWITVRKEGKWGLQFRYNMGSI
tara:strand:- start:140 stop:526 length:387 start_codon:yes stop_codon:yes gene_type:complete